MDKPLSDPQKKDDVQTEETSIYGKPANTASTPSASPFTSSSKPSSNTSGAYGTQTVTASVSAPAPDLSSNAWEESKKNTKWNATPQGRAAIRAISRGVLGASAFAAGGFLAEKWMKGIHFREGKLTANPYNAEAGFFEQHNPLQFVAKTIDTVVGKPIQWGVSLVADEKAALNAVRFRPTKYKEMIAGKPVYGRSLGAETVGVTFDFFCASIGDAFGRDLVNLIDPNQKKPWRDDKGNLDIGGMGTKALKTAWRYVSYNGGEDWAVAIPYVYFMKGQRALIDHCSPGFKYDFDRGINGGSFKVDDKLNVKGSYGLEGLLDLQSRFTVYNVGTLMYREAYNHVANTWTGKPSALYGAPDDPANAKKGLFEKIGDLGKWAVRSAVKGTIYMTPAVPFFWATRSTQLKHKGVFINQDKGILEHYGTKMDTLRASELTGMNVAKGQDLCYGNFHNGEWQPTRMENTFPNPYDEHFRPYHQGGTVVDRSFDRIGRANQAAVNKVNQWGEQYELYHSKGVGAFNNAIGADQFNEFTNRFANAAIAYTPYMYAKAEFANLWDDGKMDTATERMINGATKFNWGEFKAGAGEVWNSIMQRPLSDPMRETEAQRRIKNDPSAPVDFVQTQSEQNTTPGSGIASWKERIVSGKPDDKKADKPMIDSRPRSYAESEAMKKALVELKPPTSAIH